MSNERIIPITVEKSEDDSNGSNDSNISKPMEQLSLKNPKPSVQVKPKPNVHEEFLKQFDDFEEHSNCTLPNANVPEKIILVIDQAQDENYTAFKLNNKSLTPLTMLKRAIYLFIKLKHMINKQHSFAVVILNTNSVGWYLNFSSDLKKIKHFIDKLEECEVEDTFKMNSLFEEILENIRPPEVMKHDIPPPFLVRMIFFYGRSYTFPVLELSEEVQKLLQHPYFICDIIMTHEPIDKGNHCKKIFEALQNLDNKGYSYFFPVGRDVRRLHTCMAKLLAHPLQRPTQKLRKT